MRETTEIIKLERVITGYLLNNPNLFTTNIDIFSRDIFTDITCQKVISAIVKLNHDGKDFDILSLSDITKLDIVTISELFEEVDYNVDFKSALSIIVTSKIEISTIMYLREAAKNIIDGADVYKTLTDIKEFVSSNEIRPINRITHIIDHLKNLVDHIKKLANHEISGIRTKLDKFDEHTGGLQPTDLIIVAGEPSQGKTALALTIAHNVAIDKCAKVGIFSLEMSELQLTARLASMSTNISSKQILFAPLNTQMIAQFKSGISRLSEADIYIDDCKNSNIDYIISGIKTAYLKYGIQVAIVDYLQLIKDPTKRNDESEIASNTRRFKNIAKELNITVILLSQLRRADNPKPTIGRLRGSGQIEEAADLVILLWRPEYYNILAYEDSPLADTIGTAEAIIAKGRNYGVGKFWLKFNPMLTYFSNCDYQNNNNPPLNVPF